MTKTEPVWKDLETDALNIQGTGVLKRMLSPNSLCTMFLGVKRPSMNRVFMLQAPRNLLPSRSDIPESRGFELTFELTGEEAPTHITFVLSSTDKVYNEIFTSMIDNLTQSLENCANEFQVVRNFLQRLTAWQMFFQKNAVTGLSEEAQHGLYGELYFVKNHLLSTSSDYSRDISGWTGSRNRQHDFQFGETVVEVKTCSSNHHQKIRVSNEQQLDESLVENLFVFYVSLAAVENHKDTLPACVSSIREILQLNFKAISDFEQALIDRGYLDSQSWRYKKTGYVIRETMAFKVEKEFPRLTERDLPQGVGDLAYSINVAECKNFEVSLDDVMREIRKALP